MVEGGTPNTLLRMGLDRNMLKPGTEIIVRGYQAKDKRCLESPVTHTPTCKANGRDITFLDGPNGDGGSNGGGSASGAPSSSSKKSEDVVIEDIDDKPIDLSEIPF